MTNFEDLSKGDRIKADLYSRPNYICGKYQTAGITDLVNFTRIRGQYINVLKRLQTLADLADRTFEEAKAEGRDIDDPNVLMELGKKINEKGSLKGFWGYAFKTLLNK